MWENGKSMKIVTKNQEEPKRKKLGNNLEKKRKVKKPSGIKNEESKNEVLFSW